jgi:dephospho-CoA kinase
MPIIIIHGAPGSGKSTLTRELHERLACPWFEFGWIPEFNQLNPHTRITQAQEEQLSFENLVLVAKNYLRHGFEHILLSDLNDVRLLDIPVVFKENQFLIMTLVSENEELIKERILTRDNGNTFKDVDQALSIHRLIQKRALLPNEHRLRCDLYTPPQLADQIQAILSAPISQADFHPESVNRADYYSYIKD